MTKQRKGKASQGAADTYSLKDRVSHLVAEIIALSGLSRTEIARRMSCATGLAISKSMLDGYSSVARTTFNIPAYLVPVLEDVCGSVAITEMLAHQRGMRLLHGKPILLDELAQLEQQRMSLDGQIATIKWRIASESAASEPSGAVDPPKQRQIRSR